MRVESVGWNKKRVPANFHEIKFSKLKSKSKFQNPKFPPKISLSKFEKSPNLLYNIYVKKRRDSLENK
jgi:hypothetical protein